MAEFGGGPFVPTDDSLGGVTSIGATGPGRLLDSLQFTPYLVPLCVSIVVTTAVMCYGLIQGRDNGFDKTDIAFVNMLCGGTIWTGTRIVQLATSEVVLKEVMVACMYVGYGMAVVSLLFFALSYTGRERYVRPENVVLVSIVPVIGVVLAAVNIEFQIMWEVEKITTEEGHVFIDRQFLPLFYPITVYAYSVLLVGLYLLFKMAITSQRLYRRQAFAIIAGTLIPMTTGALFVIGRIPLLPDYINPTPIAFAVLGLLFGYSVYCFELLDVVPIGRETAWDEMDDAVVTLDSERRVVDCNAAAHELFDAPDDYVGQSAAAFFDPVSTEFLEPGETTSDVDTQLTTRIDGEERHFSLSTSPIGKGDEHGSGQVVVLRDITSLKRREAEFDLLRQVQSRVLRHNLRNELNAIRGNAEVLAEVVDEDHDDRAKDVIEASDKLLSISRKARLVEEIVDTDADSVEYELPTLLEETVATIRERDNDVTIELDVPERCRVEASPKLGVAIENLLENAVEHGRPIDPHVHVSLRDDDGTRLSITDNGPGIPEQEVTVLEDGGESQLTHGSGLGLWFVKLVADRSDAELDFDSGPDGTDVTLRFE